MDRGVDTAYVGVVTRIFFLLLYFHMATHEFRINNISYLLR